MAVDFSNKKVRYGANLQWENALMGKKGEYVIRLTKDIDTCQNARVEEVLLPQDFRGHIDISPCLRSASRPGEVSTPTDPVSTAEFLDNNSH